MGKYCGFWSCFIQKEVPIYQLGHLSKLLTVFLNMFFKRKTFQFPSFCIDTFINLLNSNYDEIRFSLS